MSKPIYLRATAVQGITSDYFVVIQPPTHNYLELKELVAIHLERTFICDAWVTSILPFKNNQQVNEWCLIAMGLSYDNALLKLRELYGANDYFTENYAIYIMETTDTFKELTNIGK